MTLPALDGIEAMSDATWVALSERLRAIGLGLTNLEPVIRAVGAVHPVLRRPVQDFALRSVPARWAAAARLLMFRQCVERPDAEEALGDLLAPLEEAELVRDVGGRVTSAFEVALVGDDYLLCDSLGAEPDAAMGLGATTVALCRAVVPPRPVEAALDLGCGAGAVALVLARVARRVVATDVNPRALRLARINARWNGHANIEVRLGSLFEPVAGERFDRIASQPPFVARPSGADDATFLYGGARGDELAGALLRSVEPHLSPGARALFVVEWPLGEGEMVSERVRTLVGGQALDALVLSSPPVSLDEHTAEYAAGLHPTLGEAYEREFARRRGHLDAMGVHRLELGMVVLEPAAAGAGRVDMLRIGPLARLDVQARRIDALVAGCRLARDRDALLRARARVPAGTWFREEQEGPGADRPSTLEARFSSDALLEPIGMTPASLALVTHLHEAPDVAGGLALLQEQLGDFIERADAEAAAATAVRSGLLEVTD